MKALLLLALTITSSLTFANGIQLSNSEISQRIEDRISDGYSMSPLREINLYEVPPQEYVLFGKIPTSLISPQKNIVCKGGEGEEFTLIDSEIIRSAYLLSEDVWVLIKSENNNECSGWAFLGRNNKLAFKLKSK